MATNSMAEAGKLQHKSGTKMCQKGSVQIIKTCQKDGNQLKISHWQKMGQF